eukprot:gene13328-20543_t
MATSDVALSVEDYDDDGLLFIHQADNETAVGSRIAGIARDTFERHCTATECDWSQIARLRTIGDDLVAFAELVDPIADGLGILLVVAVSKSEILEPAKELNMNIAFISCSILLVMSVVSFVVASKLASPIAAFADRLLAASAMADLDVSHTKSRVAELALMEDALQVLVVQLLEYKSFLPASMFEALPIGQLDVRKKFPWLKTSVAALHLIMRTRKAENEDEWMYQVAQLESSVSKENKPAVADLLTKSYNDFADACSYTL